MRHATETAEFVTPTGFLQKLTLRLAEGTGLTETEAHYLMTLVEEAYHMPDGIIFCDLSQSLYHGNGEHLTDDERGVLQLFLWREQRRLQGDA